MFDIFLESLRFIVLLFIVIFLKYFASKNLDKTNSSWKLIELGFLFLMFGSVLDITDNFESLNRYIIIGDTQAEAFLEKVVGYLGGFALLALGLYRWIPSISQLDVEREEHQIAESALQLSEDKYRGIFNESIATIYVFDHDKNFIDSNQAGLDMLGYSREELLNMSISDVDADQGAVVPAHKHLLSGGRIVNFEHRLVHKDGHIITVLNNSRPLTDSKGEVIGMQSTLLDITERNRSELALNEAVASQKAILSALPDLMFELDEDGRYLQIWSQNPDELAHSKEKLLGHTLSEMLPADAAEQGMAALNEAAEKGSSQGQKIQLNTPSGEQWFELSTSYVANSASPKRFIVLSHNITEREKTEYKLQDREERLRSLFELSPFGIALNNYSTGDFVELNSALISPTGYSKEEFTKLSYWDITPIEYEEQEALQLESLEKTGRYGPYEKEYIRKDGSRYPVLLNGMLIDDSSGDKMIWSIVEDISERKKVEKALSESEEKYRLLFERSEDPMWIISKNKFEIANVAAAEILGYNNISELTNTHPSNISPEYQPNGNSSFEMANEMMAIAFDTGYHRFEWRHKRKSGNEFPVEVSLTKVPYEGDDALFCIWRDITERKNADGEKARLQRELEQAHKMESLGHLTGGIAHDFNNLLNIISGFTEMSLSASTKMEYSKLSHYLSQVKNASQRATNLVSQMLSFSRKDQSDSLPINIASVLKEEIKMLRATLPTTIELDTVIDEDLPAILMNPTQLQQMVMNLCVNARDAMDGEGKLGIRLGWARVLDTKSPISHKPIKGDWIKLTVTDTGSGINANIIGEIFTPFFTTKEVGKGTGMGLSVVYGIMENHGGHILIESEQGKGTSLHLLFPPIIEEVPLTIDTHLDSAESIKGNNENILIVDDEESIAMLMGEMLTDYGYQTTITVDSIEALNLFKTNPDKFSMLITDQTMPRMTGLQLITQIREIQPNLPVILCSGFSDKINKEEAEIKNINYFNKPVDFEKLKKKMALLLNTD